MSAHIPGNDPNQNKAVWIGLVRNELHRTRYTVTFNGQEHSVYSDDIHLYVLDEWHGHLEVLEMQQKAGPTRHLGVRYIEAAPGQQPKLGPLRPGGVHHYVLQGASR